MLFYLCKLVYLTKFLFSHTLILNLHAEYKVDNNHKSQYLYNEKYDEKQSLWIHVLLVLEADILQLLGGEKRENGISRACILG